MIARRAREIEPFLAVEVFQRAQALERAGVDVIHLEFGEPDFETPSVIREAAEKALKDGRTRYAHTLGILPLREAIAEHYRTRYDVDVSPDRILVTAGTSPAMLLLFGAVWALLARRALGAHPADPGHSHQLARQSHRDGAGAGAHGGAGAPRSLDRLR